MSRVEEAQREWNNFRGKQLLEGEVNGPDRNHVFDQDRIPLTNRTLEYFFTVLGLII